jgi:poly(3-hydroxyalkanoate) synthetase
VLRGFANFVEDIGSGTWLPRQVDTRPFVLGKNLAATPGAGRVPQRVTGADPVRAEDTGSAKKRPC